MTDPGDRLAELMTRGPEGLYTRIRELSGDQQNESDTSLLLGIAEAATFNARSEPSINWAKVADSAYTVLLAKTQDENIRERLMLSQMNLRASSIRSFGPSEHDELLSVSRIESWCLQDVPITLDLLATHRGDWLQEPIVVLRKLRRFKNRLSVGRVLVASGNLPERSQLRRWIEVRDRLP